VELGFDPDLFKTIGNVGPSAMDKNNADTDKTQENNILQHPPADHIIVKDAPPILDHKSFSAELVDIRNSLDEDAGFFNYIFH